MFSRFFLRNKSSKLTIKGEKGPVEDMLKYFFIFSGVWTSESDHKPNAAMALFNLVVLITGFLSISYMYILKYNDIDMNTEILLHTVEIFHTICAQFTLMYNKKVITRLAEATNITYDQLNLPYQDRLKYIAILKKQQKPLLKLFKFAIVSIIIVYISVIIDSNTFFINRVQKILYPSSFPFETNKEYFWFYLATLFELMIYTELLFVDLATAGLWYGTINSVSGILEILADSFQSMTQEIESKMLVATVYPYHTRKDFREKMKIWINTHNFVKELVKDLNSSIGLIFLEVVLTSQIAICFAGYHIIQAIYTRESTRLLKFFIGNAVFILMLFVYCASGEKLKSKSEEFFNNLYCCQWYRLPISFQKEFYFFQTIAKEPVVIHSARIMPANLHTFMSSLRAVFSYLNFLLAIKDKI